MKGRQQGLQVCVGSGEKLSGDTQVSWLGSLTAGGDDEDEGIESGEAQE